MLIEILLVLSLLVLGRASGGWFPLPGKYAKVPMHLSRLAIGAAWGYFMGFTGWMLLVCAVLGWVSILASPAKYCIGLITDNYQYVVGRGHAWFEVEWLRKRPWYGVAIRGVIGTVPFLPLLYWNINVMFMFSQVLAWPLALYFGTLLAPRKQMDAWQWSEWFRYLLVGIGLYIGAQI